MRYTKLGGICNQNHKDKEISEDIEHFPSLNKNHKHIRSQVHQINRYITSFRDNKKTFYGEWLLLCGKQLHLLR